MSGTRNTPSLVAASILWLALAASSWYLGGMRPGVNMLPLGFTLAILLAAQGGGPRASVAVSGASLLAVFGLAAAGRMGPGVSVASVVAYAGFSIYPFLREAERQEHYGDYLTSAGPLRQAKEDRAARLKAVKAELAAIRQSGSESDALFRISREISKLLSLDEMLEFSRDSVIETLRKRDRSVNPMADSAMFMLLLKDEEKGLLKTAFSSGQADELQRYFESGSGAALGWFQAQREVVLLSDLHQHPVLKEGGLPPLVKSLLVLPLVIRGDLVGTLLVYDTTVKAFDSRDSANFRILANQLVIGIEKTMLYEKVQRLSITDGLTGLYVHRYFLERLEEELRRSARYSSGLSLLMLDIDHFKKYNDRYGHLAGDEVLNRVAAALRRQVDGLDFVARYGGEEFAIILPDQGLTASLRKAELIRLAVASEKFNFEGEATGVTISCGLACYPDHAMTRKGLVDRADKALYQSKAGGRNKVTVAS